MHFSDVHFSGVHLTDVHLSVVYLPDMHFLGVDLRLRIKGCGGAEKFWSFILKLPWLPNAPLYNCRKCLRLQNACRKCLPRSIPEFASLIHSAFREDMGILPYYV